MSRTYYRLGHTARSQAPPVLLFLCHLQPSNNVTSVAWPRVSQAQNSSEYTAILPRVHYRLGYDCMHHLPFSCTSCSALLIPNSLQSIHVSSLQALGPPRSTHRVPRILPLRVHLPRLATPGNNNGQCGNRAAWLQCHGIHQSLEAARTPCRRDHHFAAPAY